MEDVWRVLAAYMKQCGGDQEVALADASQLTTGSPRGANNSLSHSKTRTESSLALLIWARWS